MGRSIVFALTLLALLSMCSHADAQNTCKTVTSVEVPCIGVLLPTEVAADALQCMKVDLPKLQLTLDRDQEKCVVRTESLRLRLDLQVKHTQEMSRLVDNVIDIAKQDEVESWYEGGWIKFASGILGGVTLTLAVLYAAR